MSEKCRLMAMFYLSMETLEIGDVLVCERNGVELYALVKWCYESRTVGRYDLSQFSPNMNFGGSRLVSLNYSGWLEDVHGQVVLSYGEWKRTLKDVFNCEGMYSVFNPVSPRLVQSRKKEPTLRILVVGSKAFREEATEVLQGISEGKMSKDEAVNFLRRVLSR